MRDHPTALPVPTLHCRIPTFDKKLRSPLPKSESSGHILLVRNTWLDFEPSELSRTSPQTQPTRDADRVLRRRSLHGCNVLSLSPERAPPDSAFRAGLP